MAERYESLGVSATKEEVHRAVRQLPPSLIEPSFVRIAAHPTDAQKATALHTDTAGTKVIIPYLYWKETGNLNWWAGIAQDALVMNTDDLLCNGFTGPYLLVNAIARHKRRIDGAVLEAIIEGTLQFIQQMQEYGIQMHHLGGETADVGDLVRTIDVGFTVYAETQRDNLIPTQPQEGDVIIGLASFGIAAYEQEYNSGIGANGLTLARHTLLNKYYAEKYPETVDDTLPISAAYQGPYLLGSKVSCELTVGHLLASPTRTYLPVMVEVLRRFRKDIHAIIHCTGGGQTKVLHFIHQQPLHILKDQPFAPPTVFRLIQETGQISWKEMYQVFNMGWRMELYVPESVAQPIIDIAKQFGVGARVVGRVQKGERPTVTIKAPTGEWLTYHG